MTHRYHRLGLAVLVVAATMPMASAAPYTWTTSGSGSVLTDGPGTWSTSALNWTTTGAGAAVAWPNLTTDIAIFGVNSGAAGTVTVRAVSTNGITFNQPGSGTYLLSGGTISFGGTNPTITTGNGVSAAIASSATSSSGLITGGGGTLTMSGSVRLASTGTFTVGDGEVVLANGAVVSNAQAFSVGTNVVGGTATLRIKSGGSFSLLGTNQNSFIGTASAPWATVVQEGGSVTISGTPGNIGGVFLGAEISLATTYSGSSSYSMQGGSLTLSNTGGGFMSVGRNAPATFTQSGGTVTLGRTNGTVLILGDYSSGSYEMSGGSLTGTSTSANANLGNRGGTGTLTITSSGSFGIGGSIALANNQGDSATDKGSGTINLQGGDLAVNGMTRGRAGVTGSNGAGTATFNFSGGTLRPFSANTSIGSASGTSNFSISLSGTGATLSGIDRATAASRTLDVYATLDGTGNITISGGRVNLRGTNTYTGATTVGSGTLAIGVNNAISGSSSLTIGSATTVGTLALGDFTQTTASLTFSGSGGTLSAGAGTLVMQGLGGGNAALSVGADAQATIGAALSLASPTDVDVAAGRTLQLAALSGSNGLTKLGAGALTLTGAGHAGGFDIQAGRLNLNAASAIGSATSLVLGSGIELDNSSAGAVTINNNGVAISLGASLTFLGTQNLNMGTGTVTLGATSAIDVQAGTLTFGGNVVDGGSGYGITKSGTGTLVLTGLTTGAFSGNSVLNAGELFLDGLSTLGGGPSTTITVNPGTTLRIGATASTGSTTIIEAGGTVILTSTNVQQSGQTFTVNKTLSTQDTLFNGVQTIGAGVTVSGSTDQLGTTPATATQGRIVMENNAVLRSTQAININANKGIELAGASATFDAATGSIFINSQVTGTGALVKTGTGGFRILNTSNSYSGGTEILEGTFGIYGDGSLGAAGTRVLLDGATLNSGQGTSGQTVTVSSARSIVLGNGKTSNLDATNGSTLAYAGVIAEENPAGTAAALQIGTAGSRDGIVQLGGANTYRGDTIINAGTLKLASAGSFDSSPRIIVGDATSSNAILDLTDKTSFSIGSAQTLMGKGTVLLGASTDVTINGLLSPGNSPGLLTWSGSGSVALSGTTLMEVWGTSRGVNPGYDAIDLVNGTDLIFGGILQLEFSQTFGDGTTFNLFTPDGTSSLAGTFSSITMVGSSYGDLTFTNNAGFWTTNTGANNQSMSFNSATGTLSIVVVPEPAGIALAGLGLLVAGWASGLRRRRDS